MSYLDEISEIWRIVYQQIALEKTNSFAELWYKDLKIQSYENDVITFATDSQFKYDKIKATHLSELERAFANFLPCRVDIVLVGRSNPLQTRTIVPQSAEPQKPAKSVPDTIDDDLKDSFFQIHNPEYTFENFIVGNSNKFAHAACTAVAQKPAEEYNPLFIYGPSGVGKTHLICAVVNEIKRKKPDTKVIYINGEDFTNQLIESISKSETAKFHNKFRTCDVLLIDDIQFIAGKISTQEEFFHTFNTLHQEQKQIILTSDRPPKDIATLEDRLRTRFEWGLLADIQQPDLELRLAIFKQKIAQSNITMPDEVLLFLAENLRSNIRQIEGAIKKLSAKSLIMGQVIDMELAKKCLNELLGGAEPISTTVDKIFAAVYNKYGVSKEDIKGKKRTKEITNARQMAIYLIREITELSFPNIGNIVNKDHTSAMYAYDQMIKKLAQSPMIELEIEELKKEVSSI